MFEHLVEKARSYRRFKENQPIDEQILKELVDLARLIPSARNVQPIRYFLVSLFGPGQQRVNFPKRALADLIIPLAD